MTNLGPGSVYGLFQLFGFVVLALPISAAAYLLARWRGGFARSLLAVVGGLAAVGAVAALAAGTGGDAVRIVGTLSALYVAWPLAVGTGLLRFVGGLEWDPAARLATLGWVVAQSLGVALLLVGWPVGAFVDGTPTLLGMADLSGYIIYMTGIGVVGAVVGWLVRRARSREESRGGPDVAD